MTTPTPDKLDRGYAEGIEAAAAALERKVYETSSIVAMEFYREDADTIRALSAPPSRIEDAITALDAANARAEAAVRELAYAMETLDLQGNEIGRLLAVLQREGSEMADAEAKLAKAVEARVWKQAAALAATWITTGPDMKIGLAIAAAMLAKASQSQRKG